MDIRHEERVKQLIAEGLSPAEARREARAERQEIRRDKDERRKNSRLTQANVRIGVSIFRIFGRLFK